MQCKANRQTVIDAQATLLNGDQDVCVLHVAQAGVLVMPASSSFVGMTELFAWTLFGACFEICFGTLHMLAPAAVLECLLKSKFSGKFA